MMKNLTTTKTAQLYSAVGMDCLYSYGRQVLEYEGSTHTITLGRFWDYSVTTLSHIRKYFTNFFFDGKTVNTAKLRKAVKEGKLVINGISYNLIYDGGMQ